MRISLRSHLWQDLVAQAVSPAVLRQQLDDHTASNIGTWGTEHNSHSIRIVWASLSSWGTEHISCKIRIGWASLSWGGWTKHISYSLRIDWISLSSVAKLYFMMPFGFISVPCVHFVVQSEVVVAPNLGAL